ncbi:MAG: LysR family transcriptional regulator [Rhodospirillales bacterium]|nr:LysR family transcriptional regulator [Rhodospirillales bacterium]
MRLPNLAALRTFEASARHLSFVRAAGELNVQPPAVSRKAAELERELNVSLFVRTKSRLTLTPEGERFFQAVSSGFGTIAQSAEAMRKRPGSETIVVGISIGLAS